MSSFKFSLGAILVRVCGPVFFKPTPFIYVVFKKNDLFIYLIEQNVYRFIKIILFFDFYIPPLLSVNKVYK